MSETHKIFNNQPNITLRPVLFTPQKKFTLIHTQTHTHTNIHSYCLVLKVFFLQTCSIFQYLLIISQYDCGVTVILEFCDTIGACGLVLVDQGIRRIIFRCRISGALSDVFLIPPLLPHVLLFAMSTLKPMCVPSLHMRRTI